jgi:hypothetical protein
VAAHGDALYVTSTGLDLVAVLSKQDGALRELMHTDGRPVWHRFSPDVDYRQVYSTRPHDCHPNYVFWLDGKPWVTRCTQEDAVALHDTRQSIDLSLGKRPISVHDGIVRGDHVYFTLVDGTIVVANRHDTSAPVEHVDLPSFAGYGGLRGWCRGLCFVGKTLYVGFSRLRRTRSQNKLAWIQRALGRETPIEDCSVLAVDLAERRILRDYRIPAHMLDAVYGILEPPAPA